MLGENFLESQACPWNQQIFLFLPKRFFYKKSRETKASYFPLYCLSFVLMSWHIKKTLYWKYNFHYPQLFASNITQLFLIFWLLIHYHWSHSPPSWDPRHLPLQLPTGPLFSLFLARVQCQRGRGEPRRCGELGGRHFLRSQDGIEPD